MLPVNQGFKMKSTLCIVCILLIVGTDRGVCEDPDNMTTLELTTAAMDTTMLTSLPGSTPMNITTMISTTSVTTNPTTKAPITTNKSTTTPPMTSRPTVPTESPVGPPMGTWIVKDQQGGVCMKMQFGARIYLGYQTIYNLYDVAVVDIPPTADATASVCSNGTEPRHFILHLFDKNSYWYLNMTFDTKSKFSLTEVGIAITYDEGTFPNAKQQNMRSYEYITDKNFLNQSVPLGKSFTCSKGLTFQTITTHVFLQDLTLQPFADESEGDFGKTMECSDPPSSSTGLIVGVTIGVICAIILALVATVYVVKSRSSDSEDLRSLT